MLIRSALIAAGLALLSILLLDGPLAVALSSVPADARHGINQGVIVCEWLFGFHVSPYLYGGLLILAGIVAMARKYPGIARTLIFIGLTHVTARLVAGIMKLPFSRLRPYEVLTSDGWHDVWFACGEFLSLRPCRPFLEPFLPVGRAASPVLETARRLAGSDFPGSGCGESPLPQ